jgi:hypothetical protein
MNEKRNTQKSITRVDLVSGGIGSGSANGLKAGSLAIRRQNKPAKKPTKR